MSDQRHQSGVECGLGLRLVQLGQQAFEQGFGLLGRQRPRQVKALAVLAAEFAQLRQLRHRLDALGNDSIFVSPQVHNLIGFGSS